MIILFAALYSVLLYWTLHVGVVAGLGTTTEQLTFIGVLFLFLSGIRPLVLGV